MKQISIGSGKTLWFVDRDGSAYWQYQSRLEEANQQITNRGYRYIQVGGKRYLVHRLVAEAYIQNPENKRCVNHIDENKLNNSISNLEWVTHSENMKHFYRNKTYKLSGENNCNAKLSPTDVGVILKLLGADEPATKIAKYFEVGHTTIYNIKLGKSYKDAAKRAAGIDHE